jgi:hypothetical protein
LVAPFGTFVAEQPDECFGLHSENLGSLVKRLFANGRGGGRTARWF